jgi:hypothetical protein
VDAKLLIDAIVRQTTVLIAQLSTSSGIRAPLAHVADQVFLDLAQEIEAQGVGRKLVADMFGLALRSYQKKVQRLIESATVREKTLWEALLDYLSEHGGASREQMLAQFRHDSELDVGAVIADLVGQGVVYSTGSGRNAVYGLASEVDQRRVAQQERQGAGLAMVWHALYSHPRTRSDLASTIPVDGATLDRAIETLVAEGRVRRIGDRLVAETFLVPIGSEQGWEAAVFDHFSAVAGAIAAKVRLGVSRSAEADLIGGTTITFEIGEGHPLSAEVYGLLSRVRKDVNDLWARVAAASDAHPSEAEDRTKVIFYFGQNVKEPGDSERERRTGRDP